ncbi:MAG TPA: tyrosine decarboxylase MfnA [Thermoplasmatales archaeon]|nr:tyrosine decarboxylase MfnA [Thermoplasmatales archaeon]
MAFPTHGKPERDILEELYEFREKDIPFSSGRILGSMCTKPLPVAEKAYMEFLETNLGDPEHFMGAWEMEEQLLEMIKDLLHAPLDAAGQIVSGGTEGNLLAILVAKSLTGKKEIVVPNHAHFSFNKIASIMNLKLRVVDTSDAHVISINSLRNILSDKTAAVVAVAGSTELGTIDPIEEIGELCYDEHVFLHVDAAFGGFIIPFLKEQGYDLPNFDFLVNGVSTVSVDAHKMGCSAIPLGIVTVRDRRWFEDVSVDAPYVSRKRQSSLIGTRSGGPVAAAYAVIKHLGREGYQEIASRCMETTFYAKQRLSEIGLDTVIEPVLNVIEVKVKNLKEVMKGLTEKGWHVNPVERLSSFRMVMMPHITKQIIDEFIPDLEEVCKEVGEI